jgi:hypothetical protein
LVLSELTLIVSYYRYLYTDPGLWNLTIIAAEFWNSSTAFFQYGPEIVDERSGEKANRWPFSTVEI